jgi:hypothetical protein
MTLSVLWSGGLPNHTCRAQKLSYVFKTQEAAFRQNFHFSPQFDREVGFRAFAVSRASRA